MTDELMEQLRARNPRPQPIAPPIDEVLARIAADKPSARVRWPGWLGPSLAVAVAVAVAAVALVTTRGDRQAAAPTGTVGHATNSDHHRRQRCRSAAFRRCGRATDTGARIWVRRRRSDRVRAGPGSTDCQAGGVAWDQQQRRTSWSVGRRGFSLSTNPMFDGAHDGWAVGGGVRPRVAVLRTHDGGRRWAPAASAAAADSLPGDVSVAGGMVWAVGTGGCAASGCQWVVMRGPASEDRLPATAANRCRQPARTRRRSAQLGNHRLRDHPSTPRQQHLCHS